MDLRRHIAALFEELGPRLNPVAVAQDPEEPAWTVFLDKDVRVDAHLDVDRDSVSFMIGLGRPPTETAAKVHEVLLRFNMLRDETGGLVAALAADGEIVLGCDRHASGMDAPRLDAIVAALGEVHGDWAALVAGQSDDSNARMPATPPGMPV